MYKVVSLFTGAGGLDLGFEAAGFETVAAVEFDSDAVRSLRHNRDWPVLERDIHEVSSQELLDIANVKSGDIDVLIGGPPCQPFSKSGYWAQGDAKRLADPRATTLEAYLRVLLDIKPKVFLIENVAGLAYKNKDEGLELLRTTISSINKEGGLSYSFSMALLNAADYGIPQERERVFIIGQRDGVEFQFPSPTHARRARGGGHAQEQIQFTTQMELSLLRPAATAWDAIGDFEQDDDPSLCLKGKWAGLLPSIPEGCNYLYHTDRGEGLPLFGWRRRYWNFLLKLSKQYPSWTLTAQPGPAIGPFHWKNRLLSSRELCRLQTFPDDYTVLGSQRIVQRQLGNAVPSALAELLARAIRRQLLGESQFSELTPTLIPTHKTPPPPEAISEVPKEFLVFVDDHTPHPGTGKGFGAQRRGRVGDDVLL
jgi:DNA (cytosine-5)-methyltransferase 1